MNESVPDGTARMGGFQEEAKKPQIRGGGTSRRLLDGGELMVEALMGNTVLI